MKKIGVFIWRLILNLLFPEGPLTDTARTATSEYLERTALRAANDTVTRNLGILSLFRYRDPLIREMIRLLKYRGDTDIAAVFAEALYEPLLAALADTTLFLKNEPVVIVPMPLHPARERERGYNQSVLIARRLAALGGGRVFAVAEHAVIRTRSTESQTRLPRAERAANVRGSFAVAEPERLRGQVIILLDDVITTGATMQELKHAVERVGARYILPVCVAH